MNDTMLRPAEAAARLGVTKQCLYKWAREGKLAPPIKLSSHTTVWRASALEAFIAEREKAGAV
jgi:predicted DNA-binding transcriptional regulator AlpA